MLPSVETPRLLIRPMAVADTGRSPFAAPRGRPHVTEQMRARSGRVGEVGERAAFPPGARPERHGAEGAGVPDRVAGFSARSGSRSMHGGVGTAIERTPGIRPGACGWIAAAPTWIQRH